MTLEHFRSWLLGLTSQRHVKPPPERPVVLSLDSYVERYGEVYREVIEQAVEDARIRPGFNPATFDFGRYVAAVVYNHSLTAADREGRFR